MSSNARPSVKYVYELPYFERKELCRILDQDDKWEELGGFMKFNMMTIQELRLEIKRGNSPTDELLTTWGHQNHTVVELFVLLSRMQHYQSMLTLKPFVDSSWHRLIFEGEENFQCFTNNRFSTTCNKKHVADEKRSTAEASGSSGAVGSVAANEVVRPSPAIPEKNMGFGPHNLNLDHSGPILPQNKVDLPEEDTERKIINVVDNSPPLLSFNSNQAAGYDPGTLGNRARRAQQENKENNLPQVNQNRKLSNVSNASSVAESCGSIPQIEYKELVMATNGWDKATILGKGGFGTVFKGTWKNTQVAIKRIEQRGAESEEVQLEQSFRELRILNSCRHDNILSLYGFSMGGEEPCLVYQFMPNGSVEDRLLCRHGTRPLSWYQRHNIAEGTARGLQFLHNNTKPFVHGDIKSANILLDSNFEPRIGDFGLAREGPQNHYTHMKVSRVHGTRPYLPDEFLRAKQFSTKVDTFSFGIVLFELATGLRAFEEKSKRLLKDMVEGCEELKSLVDSKAGLEDQDTFGNFIILGKCCVSKRAKDRPEMEVVLKQLEGMTNKQCIVNRAQQKGHQIDPSPTNPYEMQVLHDVQTQRRRLPSPTPNPSGLPPSGSPCMSPLPYMIHQANMGEVWQTLVAPSLLPQFHTPAGHLNNNNNLFLDPRLNGGPSLVVPRVTPPPTIAVSPPTNSVSPVHSTELAGPIAVLHNSAQVDPGERTAECRDSFPDVLPLISALGMKDSDRNAGSSMPLPSQARHTISSDPNANSSKMDDDSSVMSSSNRFDPMLSQAAPNLSMPSTAKGKPLWILKG